MKFESLCVKDENKNIETWMENEKQELEDYFEFVERLIDRKDIKDRMRQMKNNLIVYIVDSNKTRIPRVLEGKDRSFVLPDRAAAFVREQSIEKKADGDCYLIKCGFAYRKNDYNGAIKFHELNHNLSRQLEIDIENGAISKSGTVISVLDLENDKFVDKTKNFIDECLTDAIAKYYYEKQCKNDFEYGSEYSRQGMTLFGEILLGKDLSDKDALNAYFGTPVDLLKFETKFYQKTGVDFRKILKQDYKYNQSLDGENMPTDQLLKLAIKYRLNCAENQEEKEDEARFLLGIDFEKELSVGFTTEQRLDIQKFLLDECEKPFQTGKDCDILGKD